MSARIKKTRSFESETKQSDTIKQGNDLISCLIPAFCIVAVYGLLFFVQAINGLYSDDFHYASFWSGNLFEFVGKVAEHYKTYNGRVLVHLFPQLLLGYPMWIHAAFMTFVLAWIGLSNMWWHLRRVQFSVAAPGVVLFGAQILLFGINTLRKSLLWSSAAYNYVFPAAFFITACFCWDRWLNGGKGKSLIWLLPLQFLSAATTEQCGAMTIAGTLLVGISWITRNKTYIHKRSVILLAPLANMAGYVTLFFTPATQERVSERMHFDWEFISLAIPKGALYYMAQKAVLPVFIALCILLSIFALRQTRRLWALLAGIPIGLFLIRMLIIPVSENVQTTVFIVFLIYIALTAVILFFNTKHRQASILLLMGLTGVIILFPIGMHAFRTTAPFAITIAAVNALLMTDLLENLPQTNRCGTRKSVTLLCITLICALQFVPIIKGYWGNHLLDKKNAAAIESAKESGILEYNIDYDPIYGFDRMFNTGYSYSSFIKLYGLEDCTVYYFSDKYESIYVGEILLYSPAMVREDVVFFPIRHILETIGGTVDWSPERTVFYVNEIVITEEAGMLHYETQEGARSVSIAGQELIGMNSKYYSAEIFEQVFGLVFKKTDGVYRLQTD